MSVTSNPAARWHVNQAGMLQVVNKYIDQGTAELVPGVLFIDEVRSDSTLYSVSHLLHTHVCTRWPA
jgi:DNA helicase TIP49 (TBP-interacting protein)